MPSRAGGFCFISLTRGPEFCTKGILMEKISDPGVSMGGGGMVTIQNDTCIIYTGIFGNYWLGSPFRCRKGNLQHFWFE